VEPWISKTYSLTPIITNQITNSEVFHYKVCSNLTFKQVKLLNTLISSIQFNNSVSSILISSTVPLVVISLSRESLVLSKKAKNTLAKSIWSFAGVISFKHCLVNHAHVMYGIIIMCKKCLKIQAYCSLSITFIFNFGPYE